MKRAGILLAVILLAGCREKYILPFNSPATGYLVVEGTINSGQGPSNISLSRTMGLADTIKLKNELQAQVSIRGDDNSNYALTEKGGGLYSVDQLSLNNSRKYQLHIKTKDGKEYSSDFMAVKITPAIDSISWERFNGGVEIFINTNDPLNNTMYYKWEFEETWEFHSYYYSLVDFIKNPVTGRNIRVGPRDPADSDKLFYCWKTENSNAILIGSSVKLSRDTIHLPIQFIPQNSWKLSVLYSIFVRQFAISPEEYEFLRKMKRNTEQVGSLFDAQPSELKGNIHCLNNPNEIVMGYIGIADAREKRSFISNSEVPGWNYREFCELYPAANDSIDLQDYRTQIPVNVTINNFGDTVGVGMASPYCADCRTRGYNIKPSFWP